MTREEIEEKIKLECVKIIDDIVAKRIVDVMNRAIAMDPKAIEALFNVRVPCSSKFGEDPTIQISQDDTLSVIGLLSGIAGSWPTGFSRVAAEYNTVCPTCGIVDGKVDKPCERCGATIQLGPLAGYVLTENPEDKS
jgi:hypothetical protein